jgi:ATP-dependent RNA helicase RhlE
MLFADLNLAEPILRAVHDEGYTTPTPIQERAIPHVLLGKDLLGCAQTGTGKTAAFALPILHRLWNEGRAAAAAGAPRPTRRPIRCLVLSPTRELAAQIGDCFKAYGKNTGLHHTVIYGGVGQRPQEDALRRGVDIVVACPGRLLDLMNQGFVDLRNISVFVLDEADRMLDMGFIHDIRKVVAKVPPNRQTLFFSATMPKEIRTLADTLLRTPISVEVAPVSSAAETVDQSVFFVAKGNKQPLLHHLLKDAGMKRVLVFTRTKHGADKVVRQLELAGMPAAAIHGNKSQNARMRAIDGFKSGAMRILVASDIAARGLDIDNVTHVVNFDVPNEPETYVHRIGRTGRAGASGTAFSFCDGEERAFLRDIERTMRRSVPVRDHDFTGAPPPQPHDERDRPPFQGRGGYGGGGGRGPSFARGQGGSRHAGNGGRPNHGRGPSHQSDRRPPRDR